MVDNNQSAIIFRDARALYADALEELERGKLRNSAEKAWGATKRATDALILARTGELPPTTSLPHGDYSSWLGNSQEVEGLVDRYYTRIGHLHWSCFYNGMCNPAEETQRRICETIDYIRDTERLASL